MIIVTNQWDTLIVSKTIFEGRSPSSRLIDVVRAQ